VVLAAVLDPIARAVMSMYWDSQDATGLPLAATMSFETESGRGRFHWEAVQVIGARVPKSAWGVPADYRRAPLPAEIP